jgi:Circularly permutated YpsA SLOG family
LCRGGQTGVDHGALDAALAVGFPCGGWATWDRMAEDGVIPERYPLVPLPVATRKWQRTQVREASQSRASDSPVLGEDMDVRTARPVGEQYRQRTRLNVMDSGGTSILYFETLKGGTRLTRNLCALLKRPYILIDAGRVSVDEAVESILKFVEEHEIRTLNVAGPRLSGWAAGYAYALRVVGEVIARFGGRNGAQ